MLIGILFAILFLLLPIIFVYHKDQLGAIGPFIGGMSLWLGAIGVWIQAHIITERNARLGHQINERNFQTELYIRAVASFRTLYDEFWKTKEISSVRRWVVSGHEYEKELKPVLIKRKASGALNELEGVDNEKLDKLDQFLSVLVRIKSFTHSGEMASLEQWQRDLWVKVLHGTWWIEFITKNRPELHDYLEAHWKKELL